MSKSEPAETAQATGETASAANKLTPNEWRDRLGLIERADPRFPQRVDRPDWRHAAAESLHGWKDDAHHFQGEAALRLTESDYRAALEAAAKYPTCAPHGPALSRLKVDKFKNFKPRPNVQTVGKKIGSGKIGQGRVGA